MSYVGGGMWSVSIAAAAWVAGVVYDLYAEESGSLGVVYSDPVICGYIQPRIGTEAWTYTLTDGGGAPIADATVWVTPDAAGDEILDQQTTNASGEVVFYLDTGTYYIWRRKAGVSFDNPDTEVVT